MIKKNTYALVAYISVMIIFFIVGSFGIGTYRWLNNKHERRTTLSIEMLAYKYNLPGWSVWSEITEDDLLFLIPKAPKEYPFSIKHGLIGAILGWFVCKFLDFIYTRTRRLII